MAIPTDDRSRLSDPAYLRFQYGDDKRLRVRIETHERYSESPEPFVNWVVRQVDAQPGSGCSMSAPVPGSTTSTSVACVSSRSTCRRGCSHESGCRRSRRTPRGCPSVTARSIG